MSVLKVTFSKEVILIALHLYHTCYVLLVYDLAVVGKYLKLQLIDNGRNEKVNPFISLNCSYPVSFSLQQQ